MPLFGSKREPVPAQAPVRSGTTTRSSGLFGSKHHHEPAPPVQEKSGLFGTKHRHEPAPPVQDTYSRSPKRSSGLFRRRSSSVSSRDSPHRSPNKLHHGGSGGLLHRNHEDPSIGAARERVMLAETAERDADRALVAAKAAVRDARGEVKRLEHEAAEEARLAKIKQGQAASLSKRGKMLGRHDHH